MTQKDRPKAPISLSVLPLPNSGPKVSLSFPAKAHSNFMIPMHSGQSHLQNKRNKSKITYLLGSPVM